MFIYPWKMFAEYNDGFEAEINGLSEDDCMEKIATLQIEHGECMWYSGAEDEDYVGGEYIGRENMIYE